MSLNSNFIYNRDANISGSSGSFDYTPVYGSSVEFTARNIELNMGDFYSMFQSMGLNNLEANWSLSYGLLQDSSARSILYSLESLQGTGVMPYSDPAGFYKDQSLRITSLEHSFVEPNLNQVSANFYSDSESALLNWKTPWMSSGSFLSTWNDSSVSYKTNNVVYDNQNTDKTTNFFYCIQDHTSSIAITTSNQTYWSQDFEWQPDQEISIPNRITSRKVNYRGSVSEQTKVFSRNTQSFQEIRLVFNNIDDNKAKAILFFLFQHQGYKTFVYRFPKTYKDSKRWRAIRWKHDFVYKNVNNLEITMREDVGYGC